MNTCRIGWLFAAAHQAIVYASSTDAAVESSAFESYLASRTAFLAAEAQLSINAAWHLTLEETRVDDMLQSLKNADNNLDPVPTQFAFSTMQYTIDNSKLFHLLKSFPKGALLHSHDISGQDMHFYVEQSYRSNCLYYTGADPVYHGALSYNPDSSPEYVPIAPIRAAWSGGAEAFDNELYQNFTLLPFLDQVDTTGDALWDQFQPIFTRLHDSYQYLPVFREYYRQIFPKLLADGITQWEMRTSLTPVYDENKTYTQLETLQFILDELLKWQAEDMPQRSSFRFNIIIQGTRSASVQDVTDALASAYELREVYPDVVIGFDLVGHEDPGKTLLYWAPILLKAEQEILSNSSIKEKLPYMFHAGESNRYPVQENLVDAVFLNTSRIGHGFGLQEFPALWPMLQEKSILVETCPISNQLLGLIVDQRNHPVGQMLRHAAHPSVLLPPGADADTKARVSKVVNPMYQELAKQEPLLQTQLFDKLVFSPILAVSVSNDDPGFWGIDASTSYDWYITVLAWDLSLSGIKQLAIDSIVFSGVSLQMRAELLLQWEQKWAAWIRELQ